MVAGDPIRSFKVVGHIIEKICMFIHNCKRDNIASQQQYIAFGLQGIILEKFLVLRKFQVQV
jgi:hypothetical protein